MGWLSSPSGVGRVWLVLLCIVGLWAGWLRRPMWKGPGSAPGVLSSSSFLAQVPGENRSTGPHEDEAEGWHTPLLHVARDSHETSPGSRAEKQNLLLDGRSKKSLCQGLGCGEGWRTGAISATNLP